jgi:hypothetical protein
VLLVDSAFAVVFLTGLSAGTILIKAALVGRLAARTAAGEIIRALKRVRAFAALRHIAAGDFTSVTLAALASRTILIQAALICILAARAAAGEIVGTLERRRALAALGDGSAGDFALMIQAALPAGAVLIQTALGLRLTARADAAQSLRTLEGCRTSPALRDRRRCERRQWGQEANEPGQPHHGL